MPDPAPDNSATGLTDFPDRLSPMLVKELRQGLRTNLFVSAFILLQGFMILCLLMGVDSGATNGANEFFWFFIFVAFIGVQPLRGFSALSSEYNLNTMDLIQLTELNSWRIIWGKWCAINAQTALLLTAVLPYLVLRYFFGTVNIFTDLGILFLFAVSSALLSAFTVGCSAFKNLIVRIALLTGCGFGAWVIWQILSYTLIRGGTISRSEWWTLGLLFGAAIFGIFFFLSLGTSLVAPRSENHSTLKRLVGLGFAAGIWMCQFIGANDDPCNVIASLILALTLIDAMTETPPIFPVILKPFSNNPLMRLASYFLTPGWHTGIVFFVVPCLVLWFGAMLHFFDFRPDADEMGFLIYGAGMIVFPLIILHLFFRKSKLGHFALYLFIQAALAAITVMTLFVAESAPSAKEEFICMFMPIPSVFFFGEAMNNFDSPIFVLIGLCWLGIGLLIPLAMAMPLFREMKKVHRANQAREIPAQPDLEG